MRREASTHSGWSPHIFLFARLDNDSPWACPSAIFMALLLLDRRPPMRDDSVASAKRSYRGNDSQQSERVREPQHGTPRRIATTSSDADGSAECLENYKTPSGNFHLGHSGLGREDWSAEHEGSAR